MRHMGANIDGQGIALRPAAEADWISIIAWRNHPEVKKNFVIQEDLTLEGHSRWHKSQVEGGKALQYIILPKPGTEGVGCVYLRDIDMEHGRAEFGIFLGEEAARGRGYGLEATRMMLELGFGSLGLSKIYLRVFADNRPAIEMYKKAGFVQEGYLRGEVQIQGRRRDMLWMACHAFDRRCKLVSFVLPCYRSSGTLPSVVEGISRAMEALPEYRYEICMVNDASPDDTWECIQNICWENPHCMGLNLAKNFGQHAALMAGLGQAGGEYVVCLDDDGQTPPSEAGKLLKALEGGLDAVYASYGEKKHSWFRNFGSLINEWMLRLLLHKPPRLYISSYFAVKRFLVKELLRYDYPYPYVIGLVLRATKNLGNVRVEHRERQVGESGYTLSKLLGLWLNGFTAFSIQPLRLATGFGIAFAGLGFLYGFYTIVKRLCNPLVPVGFSALMAAVVFFGGMLMLLLGMVGEYIGRMYMGLNRSPQYVVREKIGYGHGQEE